MNNENNEMLKFSNIHVLIKYMFDVINEESDDVSVIASQKIITDIMAELLTYDFVILDSCEINFEYDREYLLSMFFDEDDKKYHFIIEEIYDYERDVYFATDGCVLFHEDVSSNALIDMTRNEFVDFYYKWFVLGNIEIEKDKENVNNICKTETHETIKECIDDFVDELNKLCSDNDLYFEYEIEDDNDMDDMEDCHFYSMSRYVDDNSHSINFTTSDEFTAQEIGVLFNTYWSIFK